MYKHIYIYIYDNKDLYIYIYIYENKNNKNGRHWETTGDHGRPREAKGRPLEATEASSRAEVSWPRTQNLVV